MNIERQQYNQGFVEGHNDSMYGAARQYYDYCGEGLMPILIQTFPHQKACAVDKSNFQFACGYIDGYQAAEG